MEPPSCDGREKSGALSPSETVFTTSESALPVNSSDSGGAASSEHPRVKTDTSATAKILILLFNSPDFGNKSVLMDGKLLLLQRLIPQTRLLSPISLNRLWEAFHPQDVGILGTNFRCKPPVKRDKFRSWSEIRDA